MAEKLYWMQITFDNACHKRKSPFMKMGFEVNICNYISVHFNYEATQRVRKRQKERKTETSN